MGRLKSRWLLGGLVTAIGGYRLMLAFADDTSGLTPPILMVLGVVLFWTVAIKRPWFRRAGLVVAAILLTALASELALGLIGKRPTEERYYGAGAYDTAWIDVVGYGPGRSVTYTSRLDVEGKRIYEIDYEIDEHGLRRAPPVVAGGAATTLLCFGGSFMYGEAVRNEQTLPYRVGVLSDGRVKTCNFAYHGYGPHQMARILESGHAGEIVKIEGRLVAVYFARPDHVRRVLGLTPWDLTGPRYALVASGEALHVGRFDDDWLKPKLKQSHLGRMILRAIAPDDDDDAIELLGAVVDLAARSLRTIRPDAEFHVLLWDSKKYPTAPLVDRELRRRGLKTHSACEALGLAPGSDLTRFGIPEDGHPTPECLDRLARYVLDRIVRPPRPPREQLGGGAERR